MKLTDLALTIFILALFSSLSLKTGKNCVELYEKNRHLSCEKNSLSFVAESFIRTCEGKGFASLSDWQKNCGALWNLEYIAWSDASSFLEVETNKVMYGTWKNDVTSGEIYCLVGEAE